MIEIDPSLFLATPYRWPKGAQTSRGGLIHRIVIDGHVGWGETAPASHIPIDGPALQREAEAAVDIEYARNRFPRPKPWPIWKASPR